MHPHASSLLLAGLLALIALRAVTAASALFRELLTLFAAPLRALGGVFLLAVLGIALLLMLT
jgi:hypothetical protein